MYALCDSRIDKSPRLRNFRLCLISALNCNCKIADIDYNTEIDGVSAGRFLHSRGKRVQHLVLVGAFSGAVCRDLPPLLASDTAQGADDSGVRRGDTMRSIGGVDTCDRRI